MVPNVRFLYRLSPMSGFCTDCPPCQVSVQIVPHVRFLYRLSLMSGFCTDCLPCQVSCQIFPHVRFLYRLSPMSGSFGDLSCSCVEMSPVSGSWADMHPMSDSCAMFTRSGSCADLPMSGFLWIFEHVRVPVQICPWQVPVHIHVRFLCRYVPHVRVPVQICPCQVSVQICLWQVPAHIFPVQICPWQVPVQNPPPPPPGLVHGANLTPRKLSCEKVPPGFLVNRYF